MMVVGMLLVANDPAMVSIEQQVGQSVSEPKSPFFNTCRFVDNNDGAG
tara:strand:- start:189 stop:332 length:144 start_codon:yes stop_codon:yes gene_type:complete